jgi:hypothetical protein
MKKILLLLLVSILLAGCTARATEPVVSEIRTSVPTATERPRPTPTQPPTSTQEPTQTPDPLLATQAAALESCHGNSPDNIDKYIDRGYSATRLWSATVCQDNGIYTKVSELGKDKVYKIPALDTDAQTAGPDWVWEPYLWSVDGDYLYLTPSYLGSIDGTGPANLSGYGLTQLDLSSGARNVLLQPRAEGYTFALSEDGRLFAYLTDVARTISILDVKTKEKQKLSLDDEYSILDMRWTPDGARLLILTEESGMDPNQGGFSIFEYSLEGKDLKKLVDKNNLNSLYTADQFDEPRLFISGLTNDILSLSDRLGEALFEVNLQSGEVIQTDALGTPVAAP